jgi:hypothetical protein
MKSNETKMCYPQDGHGIFAGRDDDDAGILRECGFEVPDEDAEKRDDPSGRVFRLESEGAGQGPSVLVTRLSRQQSAGQKVQLRLINKNRSAGRPWEMKGKNKFGRNVGVVVVIPESDDDLG